MDLLLMDVTTRSGHARHCVDWRAKGEWSGSLQTQPGICSKLPWGLRAEQWTATSLMTQGHPTEEGEDGQGKRGDSKRDCY